MAILHMRSRHNISRILKIVAEDPVMRTFWTSAPQGIVVPFANDKLRLFVHVNLFLGRQSLRLDVLASICNRVVEIWIATDATREYDGLEIMPCVLDGGRAHRVLRLSILSRALESARALSATDLTQTQPADGISSHLYDKSLSTTGTAEMGI
jgi:hypothetical protein